MDDLSAPSTLGKPSPQSFDSYDAIIIGGGPGGVSAAAMLAKGGKRVLLVEKEPQLGGLTAPVIQGPYRFDVGARLLMGCNLDGPNGPGAMIRFLQCLGIEDRVAFIPLQPFAEIHLPGGRYRMWSGREMFIDGLREAVPGATANLPALLDLCGRLYRKSMQILTSGQPWAAWRVLLRMPEMLRYATATLESVLARYVPDRRDQIILGSLWPYLGLPPAQASFLAWASLMGAYVDQGAYYCRGGLCRLVEAVAATITNLGGEIRLGCAARRVLVQGGRVAGVELADGQCYFAPVVVANIDPRQVFGPMMDPADSPAGYSRRIGRLASSDCGVSISILTDIDLPGLGFGYENLIFDSWKEDQLQRHLAVGQVGFLSLLVSTVADPDMAPSGQHLLSAFAGLPHDAPVAPEDIRRYAGVIMDRTLKYIPQLNGHLLLKDGSTEDGYVWRTFPPMYGWSATPWQSTLGRPGLHTPLKGLVLAGHWTRPLHGVLTAIYSGCEAARIVLEEM